MKARQLNRRKQSCNDMPRLTAVGSLLLVDLISCFVTPAPLLICSGSCAANPLQLCIAALLPLILPVQQRAPKRTASLILPVQQRKSRPLDPACAAMGTKDSNSSSRTASLILSVQQRASRQQKGVEALDPACAAKGVKESIVVPPAYDHLC
jgi:hypothetical protein